MTGKNKEIIYYVMVQRFIWPISQQVILLTLFWFYCQVKFNYQDHLKMTTVG